MHVVKKPSNPPSGTSLSGYAFDAGMRVGDTLVSIDGKDVKDTATNDVSALLKGEPGSKVKLGYTRPGLAEVQTCELIRKVVLLRDVPLGMTLGKDEERIGYVQLKASSTSAAAELAYAATEASMLQANPLCC